MKNSYADWLLCMGYNPFDDERDFGEEKKGFVVAPESWTIEATNGRVGPRVHKHHRWDEKASLPNGVS
jgi:alkyl sulfatase BDS1-like metallo-beta-lactamase superfamily hydrolase